MSRWESAAPTGFVDGFAPAAVSRGRIALFTYLAWAMGASVAWVRAGGRYQLPSARILWCYQNMARASIKKVTPKEPGRPATGRDPVLTVRLPPALESAIEGWAKQQDDKPSRSEAIRRLLEFALAIKANNKSRN